MLLSWPGLIVVSGGQAGVDRAAHDAAIARGVAYDGWCPRGGWAEDCPAPPGVRARYPRLRETPSAEPAQRTEWNVRDTDASLILVAAGGSAVSAGSVLAERLAAQYRKPLLVLDLDQPDAPALAQAWLAPLLAAHAGGGPFRLAVGGPRESEAPGIYAAAKALVGDLLDRLAQA
jgi:hypothetical protein